MTRASAAWLLSSTSRTPCSALSAYIRSGEVDLGGAVFDVEHAGACPAGGADLPAARVEGTGMEVTPARPAPRSR